MIFCCCDSVLPQLTQPGPSASAASEHSQHLPLVTTHCELKLPRNIYASQMVSQIPSQCAQSWICALEAVLPIHLTAFLSSRLLYLSFLLISLASPLSFFVCSASCKHWKNWSLVSVRALLAAVGKRRGVILGSLNIHAVSALITPAASMMVASGKWTNPSVSSDICSVAGQDGGGESGGDVGGDVGGAGRSFGSGDTGGDRGRSAVSGAALYSVGRKSTDSATLDRVGRSQFAYSWPEYSQVPSPSPMHRGKSAQNLQYTDGDWALTTTRWW